MNMEKTLLAASISVALALPLPALAGELEELKAEMLKMMQRIEELEKNQAAQTAQSSASAPTAVAKNAVSAGTDKVRVSLSGQVNRALLFVDDGAKSELHHVDNDASSTRLRVIGEVDTSATSTLGAAMEVQFESSSSASVSQTSGSTDPGSDNFTQRRFEIYLEDKNWGKVWLGQGWTASESTSEVDLSGTDLAGYSDTETMAGGMIFRDSAGALSGPTVGAAFSNMDGLGRDDRIRYDSPKFAGFSLAASHSQGDDVDAALRYAADYQGTKVAAALAYADPDSGSIDDQVNGSFSILFPSGFNLTLAAGTQDKSAGKDPSFYYGKLGYQSGDNAFSIDYHRVDDLLMAGDEASNLGLQYVRTVKDWSTEAYIGVRQYELDRSGADFDDILAIMSGARVKF